MRVNFDELLDAMIAVPQGEQISIRYAVEVILGIEILQMSIGARRMMIRVAAEDLDLSVLSKHVFVLNKRELEIFTIQNTAPSGERIVDVVYASKSETPTVDETTLRNAADIAYALIASSDRYDRYARKGEPVMRVPNSDDPLVRKLTKTCSATSVLIEEESRDRLAFLNEQLRGQCKVGPKRSVKIEGRDKAYTDRQSAKV